MAATPPGGRNDQVNRSAFCLAQLIASGLLSETEVIDRLSAAARETGDEIFAALRSGLKAGMQHPRGRPTEDDWQYTWNGADHSSRADNEPPPDDQEDAERPGASAPPPGINFIFDGQQNTGAGKELVSQTVPLEGICFVAGQSGGGKTFVAIELATSLSCQLPFFGR
jgi:hypothetical protein